MTKRVQVFSLLGIGIALITAIAFLSSRSTGSNTRRIGIFLFAQQPVLETIRTGFQRQFDKAATEANIKVEYVIKNADGQTAQAASIASFYRSSNVDAVVVAGLPAAQALQSSGIQKPIIFAGVPDPVAAGLVPRLQNHGTNITGAKYLPPTDIIVDVFKEIYPKAKTVAIIHNPGEANSMLVVKNFIAAAQAKGLTIQDLGVTNTTEIEAGLRTLAIKKPDGLFIPNDNLIYSEIEKVLSQAKAAGVPAFDCTKLAVTKGAVFSVGSDYGHIGEVAAGLAARVILQGQPVQQVEIADVREGAVYIKNSVPEASRAKAHGAYAIERVP